MNSVGLINNNIMKHEDVGLKKETVKGTPVRPMLWGPRKVGFIEKIAVVIMKKINRFMLNLTNRLRHYNERKARERAFKFRKGELYLNGKYVGKVKNVKIERTIK